MRRLLRPLWFLLAILFLLEEWLWDHLVPAVRWVVSLIPWRAFKQWLTDQIADLSPQATLIVFLIPAAIYFGLELVALWPMAYGRWILGLVVLAAAKVIGAAITAFAFEITRDKLLQMDWFRHGYDVVIEWRDLAHRFADPYLQAIRRRLRAARSRSVRLVNWLRGKVQPAPRR